MDEFDWLLPVVVLLVPAVAIGLRFRRGWRRFGAILVSATGLHAAYAYWAQAKLIRAIPAGVDITAADPAGVALEAALLSLPFALAVGLILHFSPRFFRTTVA